MQHPGYTELCRLAVDYDFGYKVAKAFDQALRLEAMAEKIAAGDERRKRDLLIALAPCLPTVSIATPI